MRKLSIAAVILALLTAASCSPRADAGRAARATLTVMAAASLSAPFNEIGVLFTQQNPGCAVQFNFAGSQQLAAQLANGAGADVFASANQKTMAGVVDSGRVDANGVRVFAQNRLLVVFPAANPAALSALQDLARPELKLVLAAGEVPVGQYSLEFLDKAGQDAAFGAEYKTAVLANVVSYEDNVKSVLAKVSLGEADAGLVYSSDVSGDAARRVGTLEIPDGLNVIAAYPIGVIQDSPRRELAQAFVELVLSAAGQEILANYGFIGDVQ